MTHSYSTTEYRDALPGVFVELFNKKPSCVITDRPALTDSKNTEMWGLISGRLEAKTRHPQLNNWFAFLEHSTHS